METVSRRMTARAGLFAALFALSCGNSSGEAGEAADEARAHAYVARLTGDGIVERFVEASALFLGTDYAGGPLGEGEGATPDPDPRVDFDRSDCVTYLEQCLALAVEPRFGAGRFLDALDAIRYRDGEVTFAARNHYVVRDWIPANDWLVRDVTEEVGAARTERVTRTIDRAEFLREQGVEPRPGLDDARAATISIVPSDSLAAVRGNLLSGDLLFWVGRKEGIFALHSGLVVHDARGDVRFRHASSSAGKVTDEPLLEYAERSTFDRGVIVLRIRFDASPPGAGE